MVSAGLRLGRQAMKKSSDGFPGIDLAPKAKELGVVAIAYGFAS